MIDLVFPLIAIYLIAWWFLGKWMEKFERWRDEDEGR